MNLPAVRETRRAQRKFPPANHGLRDGEGKENAGSANVVMIEKIDYVGAEVVGIDHPAAKRNCYSELVLFVALAMERGVSQALLAGEVDQRRAGAGFDRRSLIVMSVKCAEGPTNLWNRDRSAEAWLDRGFIHRRCGSGARNVAFGKARWAHPGREREPGKRLEFVVDIKSFKIGVWMFDIGERRVSRAVVEAGAE